MINNLSRGRKRGHIIKRKRRQYNHKIENYKTFSKRKKEQNRDDLRGDTKLYKLEEETEEEDNNNKTRRTRRAGQAEGGGEPRPAADTRRQTETLLIVID